MATTDQLLQDWLALPNREAQMRHLQNYSTEEVDALLTALKARSEQHLVTDTRAAEQLADLLIEAANQQDHKTHRALGLLAKADALRLQGQLEKARSLYDQAGERADRTTWARSRTGWVLTMHYLGRGNEALSATEEALDVLLNAGEFLRAGGLCLNTGLVCYELGQYARSNDLYARASQLYQQAAHPGIQALVDERVAKADANMAVNHALLGDFAQAFNLYEHAKETFERLGQQESALRVEHYIAALYAGQGQLTRALKVHEDALATAERAGMADTVVEVALEMIRCYAGLNRHADALKLAEQLVARCEANDSPTEAAKARLACAESLASLGNITRAVDELDRAAASFSSSGQLSDLAATNLLRARLHLAQQDWQTSITAAEAAQQAFAQHGVTVAQAQAELVLAHAHLGLHQPGDANEHAHKALECARDRDLLPLAQQAHHLLARAADARDDSKTALAEYAAAVADLERVQSRIATQLRLEFLGDKLAVFHDAIDLCLRNGDPAAAFGYLERAKSRALVDYLTSNADVQVRARDPAEQALLDELTVVRDEHHWFTSRLQDDAVPDPERTTLHTAVAERESRITRIHERLALLRDAEGLEAIGWTPSHGVPDPPTVPRGSVLLEYLLRDEEGLVFVLTAEGMHVQQLPTGARGVQRLLGRWQLNLDSVTRALGRGEPLDRLTSNAHGNLLALYRALIEPVASYLEGAERLVVIPYGPAHAVPFTALYDGEQHLIDRLAVVTCPSSTLLELSQRRPHTTNRGALIVGHSRGGQLKGVIDEARSIANLVPGTLLLEREASRAAVLDEAPRRDIVHLAAHGEARLDNPLFAHVELADGQLSMVDVFNLRLDGALVTLSACETGRTAVVGGDELVGLSRGFLFAGAATLVQSLWRVDDGSTARLMQCFYGDVVRGLSPGVALRNAQRGLRSEGLHPHLWAAFQLVGRDA